MIRNNYWLPVLLLIAFGIWGCGKGANTAASERVRQLEAQVAKLEEDMKALNAAKDTFRVKMASAEQQARAESTRALVAEKARDLLTGELKTRVTERDELRGHLETFRRDLQQMLGRTETALGIPAPGGVTVTPASLQK